MTIRSKLNISATAALLCTLSSPVAADFVGLSLGVNYWMPDFSGEFNSTGNSKIDLADDLDLDNPSTNSIALTVEHPIPVLPNFRYQGYDLDSSGRNALDAGITFEGQTYGAGETVTSTVDLSHDELVLYYEVLDNWVSLDLGVNLKRFDGKVSMAGSVNTAESRIDISETIPMVYLSARFDLPVTGLYVGAEISNLSIGDSSADDSTLKLGYESASGLGVEGGIKTFSLKLDDADNLDTDIEYDGMFVNGFYHF